jgi:hypothetical protein
MVKNSNNNGTCCREGFSVSGGRVNKKGTWDEEDESVLLIYVGR